MVCAQSDHWPRASRRGCTLRACVIGADNGVLSLYGAGVLMYLAGLIRLCNITKALAAS